MNQKKLKVIYYDENAAMDYVTIMNDGNITIEEIDKAIEGHDAEEEQMVKHQLNHLF